jgi:predicted nucleotidyltransferase
VNSDVDLLATFSPDAEWGLLDHIAMQHELQDMLHRPVELVSRRALERSQQAPSSVREQPDSGR